MTLILTRASKNYVVQVIDRLVTLSGKAFDEVANKNLLFCASNAIVAMGYTGHAFIGDVPTDQWIVETLTGQVFDRDRKPPALSFVQSPKIDLGRVLIALKDALDNAPVATRLKLDWVSNPFDLCVAGWQWKKRRCRPIMAKLSKPRHSRRFQLAYAPRHSFYPQTPATKQGNARFMVSVAPADNILQEELQQLVAELPDRTLDEAERILVGKIRDVSNRLPVVGPHCLSIVLYPPSVARVRVRYMPLRGPSQADLVGPSGSKSTIPVAYSPWVVGPNLIAAPSVFSGTLKLGLDPYTVGLEGPEGPRGSLGAMSGQARPQFRG